MVYAWLVPTLACSALLIGYLFIEDIREWVIDFIAVLNPFREDAVRACFPWIVGFLTIVFAGITLWQFTSARSDKPEVAVADGMAIAPDTEWPVETVTDPPPTPIHDPRPIHEPPPTPIHPPPPIHEPPRSYEPPPTSIRDASPIGDLPPQDNEPPPVPTVSFSGKVVAQITDKPIPNCSLSLEQSQERTTEDGSFVFHLRSQPLDESLLHITHDDFRPDVFRFGDLRRAGTRAIELAPKWRFLVAEFEAGERNKEWDSFRKNIVARMSERLNDCSDIAVLAGDKRDQVVAELYRFQESRGLYDKETLAKVGSFHGATHGIFGSIRIGNAGGIDLECSLIHLESGKRLKSASTWLESEQQVAFGANKLVDELLAKISTVKILFPQASEPDSLIFARPKTNTTVQGHIYYLPKSWTLWISVLPHGSENHYPQLRLTTEANGSWLASRVQIGPDGELEGRQDFEIYAVLASPEGSKKIEEYHKKSGKTNDGLALNAWDESEVRLLGSIRLTRDDAKNVSPETARP